MAGKKVVEKDGLELQLSCDSDCDESPGWREKSQVPGNIQSGNDSGYVTVDLDKDPSETSSDNSYDKCDNQLPRMEEKDDKSEFAQVTEAAPETGEFTTSKTVTNISLPPSDEDDAVYGYNLKDNITDENEHASDYYRKMLHLSFLLLMISYFSCTEITEPMDRCMNSPPPSTGVICSAENLEEILAGISSSCIQQETDNETEQQEGSTRKKAMKKRKKKKKMTNLSTPENISVPVRHTTGVVPVNDVIPYGIQEEQAAQPRRGGGVLPFYDVIPYGIQEGMQVPPDIDRGGGAIRIEELLPFAIQEEEPGESELCLP